MADTRSIPLPIAGATLHATEAPGFQYTDGTPELLFDAASDEFIYYTLRLPTAFSASPTLVLQYKMASAASGSVVLACAVMAVTPNNEEDMDDSYDTPNTVTDAVPASAGDTAEASIALTNNDSVVAGDTIKLKVYRDANAGADNAAGDLKLLTATLTYDLA